jgi:hypothetical protein
MSVKNFKKLALKDKESSKLQENVELVLKPIINSQIIDGVLLKCVDLQPGKRNEVQHKLGRLPLGYIVVRKRADARIWDLQDTNPAPGQTFSLACSHAVQVDLWIF